MCPAMSLLWRLHPSRHPRLMYGGTLTSALSHDEAHPLGKIPVTVLVLAKNEEAGLANTLNGLREFDQVVVIDSNSVDRTPEIALECGAELVNFTWNGEYPKKKQWALESAGARHPWILLLDADEIPSDELVREIRTRQPEMAAGRFGAYEIELTYKFAGKFLTHGHRVVKRSLLNPKRARHPVVDDLNAPGIREVEGHYQPVVDGDIGKLSGHLFHDDRDPVASWFDRHNRYSDWEAFLHLQSAAKQDIASKRSRNGRIFDKIPFKPGVFFLYSYVARAGFLDGKAGFDYAMALSMYYWQIGVKVRELRQSTADTSVS
jgi:glycosyltransferase involved in cell wall biosynthesis